MTDSSFLVGIVGALVIVVVAALILIVRRSTRSVEPVTTFSPSEPLGPSDMFASDFRLTIQDVFMIKGRGLVVTGKVETGSVQVGQQIVITSPDGPERYESQVKGLETFHKTIETAQTGDNVGVMLDGLTKNQIKPGMIITQRK